MAMLCSRIAATACSAYERVMVCVNMARAGFEVNCLAVEQQVQLQKGGQVSCPHWSLSEWLF